MATDIRTELEGLVSTTLVSHLEALVETRAAALVATLLNGSRPAARTPTTRGRPRAQRGGASNADQILSYVKAHPGERSEKVRAALGIKKGAWVYAINGLVASKKIGRKGIKRASTLHAT